MGGSQRRDATGGSAKGTARNCRVFGNSGSISPVKVPVEVRTVRCLVFGQADPFWMPRAESADRARRDKTVSFMMVSFWALGDADDKQAPVVDPWFLTSADLCLLYIPSSVVSHKASKPFRAGHKSFPNER